MFIKKILECFGIIFIIKLFFGDINITATSLFVFLCMALIYATLDTKKKGASKNV